jgi:hypothetical protein
VFLYIHRRHFEPAVLLIAVRTPELTIEKLIVAHLVETSVFSCSGAISVRPIPYRKSLERLRQPEVEFAITVGGPHSCGSPWPS